MSTSQIDVGDVVTADLNRNRLMTVERLEAYRGDTHILCSWFEGTTKKVATFSQSQLELHSGRPFHPNPIVVGDSVKLRSGGPEMKVGDVRKYHGEDRAQCAWPHEGTERVGNFPPSTLERVHG